MTHQWLGGAQDGKSELKEGRRYDRQCGGNIEIITHFLLALGDSPNSDRRDFHRPTPRLPAT
jgi:hypothetical protein